MRTLRTLFSLLIALCSLTAAAQELTVTSLTSNATDGIVLTFSQDVKVSHSIFGVKCYSEFTDKNAVASALNATPHTQGNVVTLTAAYCTFVNGHNIHLVLNPTCFTTLDGSTQLTGDATFDFVMGDGAAAEPITAIQIAPSNGTLTHLGNIAVVFTPTISGILDPAGFTVTNENGHSLPILNVIVDTETAIHALNVNLDPERTKLEGGTTYSLHIAPGALKCGSIINQQELVYGKWYIKPEPLVLISNPPHQRLVENISQITLKAENGKMLHCTDPDCTDLQVTGIMEDQSIVFASVTKITSDRIGSTYTLTFDKAINPETLIADGAMYSFAKLSIPAGLFSQGTSVNDAFQLIWKIGTPKPLGAFSWNFTPHDNLTLTSLGTPLTVEREDGESYDVYTLRFGITGPDAYMTITDAQNITLVNTNTGETVKTFSRNDLRQENTNAFMLLMDSPITQNGEYSLIIPAASVNYYSDAEHYSAPQHPADDIQATWTVSDGTMTGIDDATPTTAQSAATYDLLGRPQHSNGGSIVISKGRKHI